MSEFTTKDRILITRHDIKLSILCNEFAELKKNLKDDKKDLKEDLGKIFDKLDNSITNCSLNRANCQNKVNSKIDIIEENVYNKVGKFFTKEVLMWIFFFIISGVIGVAVFSGKTFSKASVNEQRIKDIYLEKHLFYNKKEANK